MDDVKPAKIKSRRWRTPTVIQMEAVECGAASLGIILGYWGRYVPLEELRLVCGVSRDGSNALNMIRAAAKYGLEGKGYKKELDEIYAITSPVVVLWELNHFLVVEGFGKNKVYLNDPGSGPRTVSDEEFDEGYSGIMIAFTPTADFKPGGRPLSLISSLLERLEGVYSSLFFLLLAGLCLLLPGLALPTLIRVFTDGVLSSRLLEWKDVLVLGTLTAAVVGGTLNWLQQYYLNRLKVRLSIKFSTGFLWHILKLPLAFYTQRFPGEIASRTALNAQIAATITSSLATTSIDVLLVVVYGYAILSYDWVMGGVAFLAAALNFLMFMAVQRSRMDAYARLQQETGKWIGTSIGALQHIETIKATGIESDFFIKFAGHFCKNLVARQEINKKDTLLGTTTFFLQAIASAALLYIGSLRVMMGNLSLGELVALQTLLISFLSPITRFVNFGQMMQNLKIDIARVNDVLKNKVDPLYSRSSQDGGTCVRLEGHLEFRNVTFGYSPLAPPLIEKLSFVIRPGQRLALVGPSGCGKSTIAKLASGLYVPWEGEILYDGKPLKEIPQGAFSHSFASVDQDIFIFSGTLRENLTLWNTTVTDEMLVHCCQDASIHDEIMQREHGYDSMLIEAGRNLSGGQRQRLEIARALLYSPSILVMDEATSALDSETEKSISDKIRRKGCSAIMIAHRLSTIQDCDEIIVLENGKAVQRGSHEDLKKVTGVYMNLVRSEAQ